KKEFSFTVPMTTYTETVNLVVEVHGPNFKSCSDSVTITIKPIEELGDEQNFSWDLRLFAEYQQPADAIPELSIFNPDLIQKIIDMFDGNPPDGVIPQLLAPQDEGVYGSSKTIIK